MGAYGYGCKDFLAALSGADDSVVAAFAKGLKRICPVTLKELSVTMDAGGRASIAETLRYYASEAEQEWGMNDDYMACTTSLTTTSAVCTVRSSTCSPRLPSGLRRL